jgi:hypothetical protein
MAVKKYSKKPEIVEAVEYLGNNQQEILDFCSEAVWNETQKVLFIGAMPISVGQWVAKDEGDHFSIKSDFLTYYKPGGGP